MELARELRDEIRAYVESQTTLADLREWLDTHADAIETSDDPAVVDLSENAWILFAERDRGHRDEESLRAQLGQLVPRVRVSQPSWSIAARTDAQHVSVAVERNFTPRAPRVVVWATPIPHATTSGAGARP